MKKFFTLLLFMAFLTPWAVNAQNQLNEGFEDTGFPPEDWTAIHVTGSQAWARSTGTGNTGSAFAYRKDVSGGYEDYLITPKLVPASGESLSFYLASQYAYNYSNTTLTIEVSTTTPTVDAFTTVLETYTSGSSGNFGTSGASDWVNKTVDLAAFEGQEIYIAFHAKDIGYNADVRIDDVSGVTLYVPACPKPTALTASNITAYDATLSWTENGSATNWELQVSTDAEFATDVNTELAGGTPILPLVGFTPATTYYARVKSDCDSEWSAVLTFTTGCAAMDISAGWSVNFDSYTTGNLPICWTRINTGTSYNSYPSISSSGSRSTSNCLYFYTYGSKSSTALSDQYAVLPEMQDLDGKQITLWAKGYNANSTFEIGMMGDPADENTFKKIAEQALTTSYQEFTYDLTSDGSYVAIRMLKPEGNSSAIYGVYIDDITIHERPECEKPSAPVLVDVTTTTATLSWTLGFEESAWQICLNGDEENLIDASEIPFTINGLDPATTYVAKVRSDCGGIYSEWSSTSVTFKTACDVISIGSVAYSEDFDDYTGVATSTTAPSNYPNDELPDCWSFLNRSETASTYPQAFISSISSYAVSGNCLFFKSSKDTPIFAILPAFTQEIAGLQLLFSYRNEGISSSNGTLHVGYLTNPADPETFVLVETCAQITSLTEKDELFVGAPAGSRIAFKYQGGASNNYYLSIDNVIVREAPTCLKPTELAYSNVDAHNATLDWTSDATAWQISLSHGNAEDVIDVTEHPYTLDIDPETAYAAKVRAVCGSNYSDWSAVVNFESPVACPAPTNLVASNIKAHSDSLKWNGFSDAYIVSYRTAASLSEGLLEQFKSSSIPTGWTRLSGLVADAVSGTAPTSTTSGWRMTTYGLGAYNATLNIYGTSCKYWLVTPEINVTDGYQFSFDLALTDYGNSDPIENPTAQEDDRFVVLVFADNAWSILREWNNSGSEFVYNAIPATGQTIDDIDISAYAGKAVKFAFYGESTANGGDNDLHIDNVLAGIPIPAGEWQIMNVSEPKAKLTGLTAETLYDVKVQGDCGDVDGKSTETAIQFTTAIACPAPSALTSSELTSSSVKLSWTENGEAQEWQICLNDNMAGLITVLVADTPYVLSGLAPETEYSIKVRANCGSVDGESEWSNVVAITTLANCPIPSELSVSNDLAHSVVLAWTADNDSYNIQYRKLAGIEPIFSEGFETGSMPDGWTIVGNGTWSVGTGDYSASTGAHSGSYNAKINHGTTGDVTYLVTPEMDFSSESALSISLWYVNRKWVSDIDGFGVCYRVNGGEWNELFATSASHEDWTEFTQALPAGALASNCQIGFRFTDGYGYGVGLDDIVIGAPVVNPWNNLSTTEKSIKLSGLDDKANYEVQVQGVCGTDATEWSDLFNFTTRESQYVVIGEALHATYHNELAYTMPNDVEGYSFEADLHLHKVFEAGDVVPAETTLVLKATAADTYELAPTDEASTVIYDDDANLLIGVLTQTYVYGSGYKYYVLSLAKPEGDADPDPSTVGFYWYNADGSGGFYIPAHKAYLKLSNSQANNAPGFIFDENGATSLENLKGVEGALKFIHEGHIFILRDGVIYDATGRKVRTLE